MPLARGVTVHGMEESSSLAVVWLNFVFYEQKYILRFMFYTLVFSGAALFAARFVGCVCVCAPVFAFRNDMHIMRYVCFLFWSLDGASDMFMAKDFVFRLSGEARKTNRITRRLMFYPPRLFCPILKWPHKARRIACIK